MPFTEGVDECEECMNWLNDDGECENSDCKLSPFYVGQDVEDEDEEDTEDDFAECIDCGRHGCKGQCQ